MRVANRGGAGVVSSLRGNPDHVSSKGHVCPKAFGLKELHTDPDRVTIPLLRRWDGRLLPASWDDAFEVIDRRLTTISDRHGADAVALFRKSGRARLRDDALR